MSAQFDLATRTTVATSFPAASRAATADGTSTDMKGFVGAMVLVNAGAVTGADATIILEDSDDDSAFTVVSAANQAGDLPAVITTTTDDQSYRQAYLGIRRHLRARLSAVGTSFVFGVSIVKFPGRHVNA